MKKKYIYWSVGILIVIIIAVVISKKKGKVGENQVFTEEVYYQDITESVSANGKIQPEVSVKISSEISGEIIELHVKEGQDVKLGDLLVKINPDLYLSSLNRAEASMNSAKADLANAKARLVQSQATLKNAKRVFERNQSLFKQGAISEAEFDNRSTEYDQASAEVSAQEEAVNAAMYRVRSSEATLKEARDNLKRTTIYAPADGTVSGLEVEQGERVVGTGQMAGTHMMDIAHMDVMEVNVEVNESDIVRVGMGDTALIEVDAYLNRKFKGIVTEIANAASGNSTISMDQVTNFDVKIRILSLSYQDLIKDGSFPFKPGMSATVDIQTQTVIDVMAIPIEAVTTREDTSSTAKSYDKYRKKGRRKANKEDDNEDEDEGEKEEVAERRHRDISKSDMQDGDQSFTLVFVVNDGKAKIKLVETGIQDDRYIEIKSGLDDDDEIIVGPYDQVSRKLTNGAAIEISTKEDFYSGEDK
jgi:HlyD family secretion protein